MLRLWRILQASSLVSDPASVYVRSQEMLLTDYSISRSGLLFAWERDAWATDVSSNKSFSRPVTRHSHCIYVVQFEGCPILKFAHLPLIFSNPVGDGVFDKEVKPVSTNAIHHRGEQKYLFVRLLVDLAF